MTTWHLHPLNARHGLTPVLAELRGTVRKAVAMARPLIELPDFDLVTRAEAGGAGRGGVSGRCPARGLIEITLDTARFDPHLLTRVLLRQFHHLIRWEGPGFGRALGEVLVSEGLAGHFVQQVLGGEPDPWDATVPASGVARQAMNEWARRDYDHPRWFLGKGDLRNGTGYGLGYRIVGEFMAQNPGCDAGSLAGHAVEPFRASLRQLIGADRGGEAETPEPSPTDQPKPQASPGGTAAEKDGAQTPG